MTKLAKHSMDMQSVIDRACNLDPDAFDLLVDEYAPRIRGFLRRIVRTSDIDDLVQEVFLRVVRSIEGYQNMGRFDAWIFQIARNLAYDHFRKGSGPSSLADLSTIEMRPNSDHSVSDRLELSDSVSTIERAMERLPDAERDVILLRHFGNLTFEEVADVMATPLGTALARAHRGLSKLREWVEGNE